MTGSTGSSGRLGKADPVVTPYSNRVGDDNSDKSYVTLRLTLAELIPWRNACEGRPGKGTGS